MGQVKSQQRQQAQVSEAGGDKRRAGNYAAFRRHVGEANSIIERFLDANGRMLVLSLHPQHESDIAIPMLWKRAVTVRVDMVRNGSLLSGQRRLNYKQFYKLFFLLRQYGCISDNEHMTPTAKVLQERARSRNASFASASEDEAPLQSKEEQREIDAKEQNLFEAAAEMERSLEERRSDSDILLSSMEMIHQAFSTTESDADTSEDLYNDNECVICFEREADTVLPCAHKFCSTCIDEWIEQCDTCPLCRSAASKDDSWLMIEAGDTTQEISTFLQEFITQLSKPSSS